LSKLPLPEAMTASQRAFSDACGRLPVGEEGAPGLADKPQEPSTPLLPSSLLCAGLGACAHVATPQQGDQGRGQQAQHAQHLDAYTLSTPHLALFIPAHLHRPVAMVLSGPLRAHHGEDLLRLEPSPGQLRHRVPLVVFDPAGLACANRLLHAPHLRL